MPEFDPQRRRSRSRRHLAPAAAAWALPVAVVLCAAGCGGGAERGQVRQAAERFYAAARQGDGRTACAQLSPQLRAQLVKDESEPRCAKAVLQLSLHGRRATAARVYATSAQVDLAGGDTVFLGATKLGWRIEAVGCRREDSGPFECEEQS